MYNLHILILQDFQALSFSKARCDPCSEDLDMIDVSFWGTE